MKDPKRSRDEAVRRLLGDARHDDPMPDDVVARLDGVLRELADEPARIAPVTDLATRRRRATRLLVAAAAVVVVGVGIQQVVGPESAEDSASQADSPKAGTSADADDVYGDDPTVSQLTNDEASGESQALVPDSGALAGRAYQLRRRHFSDDVTELRGRARLRSSEQYDTSAKSEGTAAASACHSDSWGQGTFVSVRYGSTPAVLVFRRPMGDTQVADLFLCGDESPVRSVTLPAP